MNSLGFDKDPAKTRVVVAMSGGVDSSVAAALLAREGYDVVGMTLQLYDYGAAQAKLPSTQAAQPPAQGGTEQMAQTRSKTCCAGQDIYDARCVADKVGIPHYVLDYESNFKQSVMDDFADSYLKGETPIPCVRCNQRVKFRDMLEAARDLGADCLATGHYAQRMMGPRGAELHRGDDPSRDQSYFLFATTQEQLNFLRFPLGHLPKTETRRIAEEFKLPVAVKPDSQDICFVPNGRYADVVARLRPGAIEEGMIVDMDGNTLGTHNGIIHFTIGQRKGLNLTARSGAEREPLFVVALNAAKKQVIVGPHEALAVTGLKLKEMNWLDNGLNAVAVAGSERSECTAAPSRQYQIKFRSTMEPIEGTITACGPQTAEISFTEAQHGVAPGQACVIYDGPRVIGGGWIASSARATVFEEKLQRLAA